MAATAPHCTALLAGLPHSAVYRVSYVEMDISKMTDRINDLEFHHILCLHQPVYIHSIWPLITAVCSDSNVNIKVYIFWEGHKILRNLHLAFVLSSASQK